MSNVKMKINLSPTKAGELYMKWSRLVKENKELHKQIGEAVEIMTPEQLRQFNEAIGQA